MPSPRAWCGLTRQPRPITRQPYYGKTKRAKFMTEEDAKKAGYNAAQEPVTKKTTAASK